MSPVPSSTLRICSPSSSSERFTATRPSRRTTPVTIATGTSGNVLLAARPGSAFRHSRRRGTASITCASPAAGGGGDRTDPDAKKFEELALESQPAEIVNQTLTSAALLAANVSTP